MLNETFFTTTCSYKQRLRILQGYSKDISNGLLVCSDGIEDLIYNYQTLQIKNAPLFYNYFYNFVKEHIDPNCSMEFISENFIVTFLCSCRQKGCATVHLKSKIPLKHFKKSIITRTLKRRVHLDDNNFVVEFEYIEKTTNVKECEYKEEIEELLFQQGIWRKTNK